MNYERNLNTKWLLLQNNQNVDTTEYIVMICLMSAALETS